MYNICAMLFSHLIRCTHIVFEVARVLHIAKFVRMALPAVSPRARYMTLSQWSLRDKAVIPEVIFKLNIPNIVFVKNLLSISKYLTDEKSELFQVKSWCREAKAITWNNADQDSMLPYGVAMRPQWVQKQISMNNTKTQWKASHKDVFWMYCDYIYN